jgi:hypothetical protein
VEAVLSPNAISRKKALLVGLALYAISFVLVAAVNRRTGGRDLYRGYVAVFLMIFTGLHEHPFHAQWMFRDLVFDCVAIFISGWINPVFLIAAGFALFGRFKRTAAILRAVVLLMLPFCWVVFYWAGLYPREGYFLWVLGIVITLFSRSLTFSHSGNDHVHPV